MMMLRYWPSVKSLGSDFKISLNDPAGGVFASQLGKAAGSLQPDDIVPAFFQPENITSRATAYLDNGAAGFQMVDQRIQKTGGVNLKCFFVVNLKMVPIIVGHV